MVKMERAQLEDAVTLLEIQKNAFIKYSKKFLNKKHFCNKYNKTTIPKTIRYQPKTLKSCFLIYPIRNLMTTTDTTNATTIPVKRIASSIPVKLNPNLIIFKRLAPNITGIARKNVNSAAATLDTPINNAPIIVAPEREVPGIMEST